MEAPEREKDRRNAHEKEMRDVADAMSREREAETDAGMVNQPSGRVGSRRRFFRARTERERRRRSDAAIVRARPAVRGDVAVPRKKQLTVLMISAYLRHFRMMNQEEQVNLLSGFTVIVRDFLTK